MALHLRVHMTGGRTALPAGRVLLLSNHETFWDGFLMRDVQRLLWPERSFHAVMLQRELSPRPWLRPLGAIGAQPGSVGGGRHLVRALDGLPSDAVLAFFPQGRIHPGSPRPLAFKPGVEVVRRRFEPVATIPVGIRLTGGRTPRADAYVSIGPPIAPHPGRRPRGTVLEAAVTAQIYNIEAFLARHGEDAPDAWPGPGGELDAAPSPPHWLQTVPWTARN